MAYSQVLFLSPRSIKQGRNILQWAPEYIKPQLGGHWTREHQAHQSPVIERYSQAQPHHPSCWWCTVDRLMDSPSTLILYGWTSYRNIIKQNLLQLDTFNIYCSSASTIFRSVGTAMVQARGGGGPAGHLMGRPVQWPHPSGGGAALWPREVPAQHTRLQATPRLLHSPWLLPGPQEAALATSSSLWLLPATLRDQT